jgi:hypothetical protein
MDNKIVPLKRTPNEQEAIKIVRKLMAEEKIAFSAHARKRMAERKVSYHQIKHCLEKGNVTEGPFPVKNGYEMRMERSVAGDWIRVVICLRFQQDMLVISVIN